MSTLLGLAFIILIAKSWASLVVETSAIWSPLCRHCTTDSSHVSFAEKSVKSLFSIFTVKKSSMCVPNRSSSVLFFNFMKILIIFREYLRRNICGISRSTCLADK